MFQKSVKMFLFVLLTPKLYSEAWHNNVKILIWMG